MIVNIAAYHFTPIAQPDALASFVRALAERLDLLGSVLVAEEGINLFLAGPAEAIDAFLAELRAGQSGLDDMVVKRSTSARVPFARLKVKRKREIIAFRQDDSAPLESGRAPAVAPDTLARWLDQGHDDDGRRVVMLDTRNREEIGYGHFENAIRLPIDNFVDLPEAVTALRDELADATVVSYCTGGIRCEKAALWMRANGQDNVLQLDGGILGYFEEVGGAHWSGRCFVFDERVALDPALRPLVDA
jgi:UPF0176 protein